MKAIFFDKHGEIDVLKYADLPEPESRPGEAIIRVKAVALNHLDIWVRRGWPSLHLEMPHIGAPMLQVTSYPLMGPGLSGNRGHG